jgi:ketosteroid isomerase-like protein
MSRENVEVVAANLREFKATQRPAMRFLAPDFVWDLRTFRGWPDDEEYRGPDGFMEFFAKWTEPYDEWDTDVEDLVDASDECVVAVMRQRGRLRSADSWVELRYGLVCTLAEGLIQRMQVFMTPDEALEAVGAAGVGDVAGERRRTCGARPWWAYPPARGDGNRR